MIHFVNSIEEISIPPLSRVVYLDDSLCTEREVIDTIEVAIEAPYEKDNWDGFNDAIVEWDCWLKDVSCVVLIHKSLPSLNAWDMNIYLELLSDNSALWEKSEIPHPEFHIYFMLADKARIDFFLPGVFPEPEPVRKRAPATHIGDIFEIPLPDNRKRYMQFVVVDSSCLGAWGVRVFKKEYALEEKPSIDDIVNDKVDFYYNTRALGHGVLYGLWSRYGKSANLGNLNDMVFRSYIDGLGDGPSYWTVWKAAQPIQYYRILPRKYLYAAQGVLCPPFHLIERIVTGRGNRFTNMYDDYDTAPFIEKLHIRGFGRISDKYIVPKRPKNS